MEGEEMTHEELERRVLELERVIVRYGFLGDFEINGIDWTMRRQPDEEPVISIKAKPDATIAELDTAKSVLEKIITSRLKGGKK